MNARHEQILTRLRAQQSVTIAELTEALSVSRETIRKDLYDLEQRGLLTKVRGGAVLTAVNSETAYPLRRSANAEAKRAIARAAVDLVTPGQTVYLDYGTTTFAAAAEIAARATALDDLTVVTCSLPIAQYLAESGTVNVLLPGGMIRGSEHSLHGPLATRNLRMLHFDLCLLGCSGADAATGFTAVHPLEAEVSALAVERSSRTIVLADHSKLGVVAPNITAATGAPELLLTDVAAPKAAVAAFHRAGLTVRTV